MTTKETIPSESEVRGHQAPAPEDEEEEEEEEEEEGLREDDPDVDPALKKRRCFRFRWHRRKCYHQPPTFEEEVDDEEEEEGKELGQAADYSVDSNRIEILESTDEYPTVSAAPKCCRCCRCCSGSRLFRFLKRLVSFALSTAGLSALMFSYTLLGGVLFHHIESPNELRTKHGVRTARRWHVDRLWNVTEALNVLDPHNWSLLAEAIIANYTTQVYRATKVDGWDGRMDGDGGDDDGKQQWSIAGSVLYSATVITTIGYGHITPKTALGRVVTILYAILGIPLTLLSITHLGGFLATVFRILYKNIFCGILCTPFKSHRNRNEPTREPMEEDERNALAEEEHRDSSNAEEIASSPTEKLDGADQESGTPVKRNIVDSLNRSYRLIVRWKRGISNALYTEDNKTINVPVYVSLGLIGGYLALGALMFGLWETEWNFLIGCYFCFITLSTIGFGDFVPGTSFDPSASQEKLVLCSLYLIFGLALLAMCFDLIQEEVRKLFRKLGQKLGLVAADVSAPEQDGPQSQ